MSLFDCEGQDMHDNNIPAIYDKNTEREMLLRQIAELNRRLNAMSKEWENWGLISVFDADVSAIVKDRYSLYVLNGGERYQIRDNSGRTYFVSRNPDYCDRGFLYGRLCYEFKFGNRYFNLC